jgi:hypothetical protein
MKLFRVLILLFTFRLITLLKRAGSGLRSKALISRIAETTFLERVYEEYREHNGNGCMAPNLSVYNIILGCITDYCVTVYVCTLERE